MYFLITGTWQEETTEGLDGGDFEWVVEAENQAAAIAQLEKGETLVSIREISVEERIEREERELLRGVKSEYISKLTSGLTIRQASKQVKELDANPEIYYLALKSFTVAKAVGSVYISYINASYPGINSGTKCLLTVETVNNALGSLLAKKERRFVVCFCRVKCRSVVSDYYVSVILFF